MKRRQPVRTLQEKRLRRRFRTAIAIWEMRLDELERQRQAAELLTALAKDAKPTARERAATAWKLKDGER